MTIAVDCDAYSKIYTPSTSAQWTALLSGLGISNPSSWWLCGESSGTLADSGSGGRTLTPNAGLSYQQSAPGWQRTGVKFADDTANYLLTTSGADCATTSGMLLQIISVGTNPASGYRAINRFGA